MSLFIVDFMTYAAPQLRPKLRLELDVVVEVELKLKSGVAGGAGDGVATHNTQPLPTG